jgi:hypothetical protein
MQSASSREARLFVISWGSRQPTCFSFTWWRQSHGTQAAKERERARVVGGSVSLLPSISPITHRNISRWLKVCSGHEVWFSYNSCHVLPTASFSCACHIKLKNNCFHFFISAVCTIRVFLFFPHKKMLVWLAMRAGRTDDRCQKFFMSMSFITWLLILTRGIYQL